MNDYPGFATSRLGVALGLEAIRMLEDRVAAAEDIDQAMVLGYRHPMGSTAADRPGGPGRPAAHRPPARRQPRAAIHPTAAADRQGGRRRSGYEVRPRVLRLGCTMTVWECMRVTESDGLVEITLDRPAERNAIDAQMVAELRDVRGTRTSPPPGDHHRRD